MLYALLIYEAESAAAGYTDEDLEEALAGHRALQRDAKDRGAFVEANQLMPATSATSVRVRAGSVRATDGPFTETKEVLIGYYVLECNSLDDAIEYAARIPHAATGGVEIRPVTYFEHRPRPDPVWTSSG